LNGFVDGSIPCPPRTNATYTADGERVVAANPLYRAWVAQDQAIVSALQSSLMEGVAGIVLFANCAQDIWSTLEHSFLQQSRARATGLHRQLNECKKLDSSTHDYYNKVKMLSDTLTFIGQPLRDAEFTVYVLAGLDGDYDNLVETVNNRDNPMPPRDLYSRLMYTEQRAEARRTAQVITDHAAYRGAPSGSRSPAPRPPPGPPAGGAGQWQTRPPPPPANTGVRQRPTCQLCGILGHLASRCHRRFKRDFLGIGNDGHGNEKQAAIANSYSSHTPSYSIDPPWYFDTGATDHLTSEMGKLNSQEPYRGHDKVRTADGSGMPITHVGQASFLSSTSRRLHLRNVLCVPRVTHNLLSVRKFTYDNDVFCEFHPFHLLIKDIVTREVLLRGRVHESLYALEAPPAPEVFSGVRVSSAYWHARLGHPASLCLTHHHDFKSLILDPVNTASLHQYYTAFYFLVV
jgi:hypothetical protein